MINYLVQLLIGIFLFIFSALDFSNDNQFFLFYSKEKTLLLLFHLILIIGVFLIGLFNKWKIPLKISTYLQSITSRLFLIPFSISVAFSLFFSFFWINSYGELLNYWYIYQKIFPFLVWFAFSLLHIIIIFFYFEIQNIRFNKSKFNFSNFINDHLKHGIISWILSLVLFIIIGNAFLRVDKGLIYTTASPFTLLNCALYSGLILIFFLFYNYLQKNSNVDLKKEDSFFLINYLSFFILVFTGQILRFKESFFKNWEILNQFFQVKPLIYIIFFIAFGLFIYTLHYYLIKSAYKNISFGNKLTYFISGSIFIIFILLIKQFGYIRVPDDRLWNGAGNPINFTQISYSFLFVYTLILLLIFFGNKYKDKSLFSIILPISIVLFSILIWKWSPDLRNYFIQLPNKPNFEYYPYSDARGFDFGGQFVRYGFGIENNLDNTYPFTMFLTYIYHLFSKQDFIMTFQIQMVLMLLLPLGIYLIGKTLGSKEVGLFTAALIIFQEGTAIRLSGEISNVHIQLLMSEIPTLLCLVWGTYFFISGLKNKKILDFILSGMIVGFASLCRLNPLFVMAAYSIVLFFYMIINKNLWKGFISFASSFSFIFVGWYFYIYKVTGYFYFWDKMRSVFRRNNAIAPLPQHLSSMISPMESVLSLIFDKLSILFNHFLHNLFNCFISLPMKFISSNPVDINNFIFKFWDPYQPWDGTLSLFELFMIILNLIIISFAIAQLWKKNSWKALIPLVLFVSYSAALGAARTSGGRYLTPINWVLLFYYGCGVWYLLKPVTNAFLPTSINFIPESNLKTQKTLKFIALVVLLSVFISMMALPIIIKDRLVLAEEDIVLQFEEAYVENNQSLKKLDDILNDENIYLIDAIALYPTINHNGVLNGHLIHDEFLDFHFAVKNDNQLKLPHDQQVYMLGYKLSYKDFSVHQLIYLDDNETWQLFFADENRLFDVLEE